MPINQQEILSLNAFMFFLTDNKFNKFGKKSGPEVLEELDDQNRPMQKVSL